VLLPKIKIPALMFDLKQKLIRISFKHLFNIGISTPLPPNFRQNCWIIWKSEI